MGKTAAVLVTVFILVIISIIGYLSSDYIASLIKPPPVQNNVLVTGVIKTGFGTTPDYINFTSGKTGSTMITTINKNGYYSITLLGNDTYNVTAYYKTLFGVATNKYCVGMLVLNSTVNSSNFSRSC